MLTSSHTRTRVCLCVCVCNRRCTLHENACDMMTFFVVVVRRRRCSTPLNIFLCRFCHFGNCDSGVCCVWVCLSPESPMHTLFMLHFTFHFSPFGSRFLLDTKFTMRRQSTSDSKPNEGMNGNWECLMCGKVFFFVCDIMGCNGQRNGEGVKLNGDWLSCEVFGFILLLFFLRLKKRVESWVTWPNEIQPNQVWRQNQHTDGFNYARIYIIYMLVIHHKFQHAENPQAICANNDSRRWARWDDHRSPL